MGKYAFIDRIFGTDDEEETEANGAFDEEDEDDESEDATDEDEGDDDDTDDDLPAEDDAALARLDKEFRKLRARVRALSDLAELRSMRRDHTEALAERLAPTVRLRTQDIIEEIDNRVTDIRASRSARGS